MRSKAHFKGHPLHPILVTFPIAFFTGAFLFDTLAWINGNAAFSQTGNYLNIAGIISGLIAALPGIVDYIYTVPPRSSAAKRGAKHGLINVCVIILFSILLVYRQTDHPNASALFVLGAIGVLFMLIAGWMGGTLVHRNQIGIDIRYANAGKWKEVHLVEKDGRVLAATSGELQLNQMKLIHIKKKRIVLGKTENGYIAFDDRCTHRGGSLAGGSLVCGTVQCPWHGSQFHLGSGIPTSGPAKYPIGTYQVSEKDGLVFIELAP